MEWAIEGCCSTNMNGTGVVLAAIMMYSECAAVPFIRYTLIPQIQQLYHIKHDPHTNASQKISSKYFAIMVDISH